MRSLIRAIRECFLGPVEELHVDPLVTAQRDEEDRRRADVLRQRQQAAYNRLRKEKKSVLDNYRAPDPIAEDRVTVYFRLAGQLPPSEAKRLKRIAPIPSPTQRAKPR